MEVANTLAYYDTATITDVKRVIVQALGPNVIQLFFTRILRPGANPSVEQLKGRLRSYMQTLNYAGKARQVQTL